jgi:S-disulfanyl-L-cysteine oxidoreductase SoxD
MRAAFLLALLAAGCGRASAPGGLAPASAAPTTSARRFGFGHPASPREIAAWDIDVRPDGKGLPPGRGSVGEGARIYAEQCAVCHGKQGEGARYEALAGREPSDFRFAKDAKLRDKRTVGNYWPYATTLFDYINRSMPQAVPGSLRPDEVYAVTAYVLSLNGLVAKDAVLDAASLPKVVMPAKDRFVTDDRRGGPELR